MAETIYSIEAPDGKRYDPVPFATLREWASEGRVVGETTLIVHPGGARVKARDVPGLFKGPDVPPVIAPPTTWPGEIPPPPAKKGFPNWAVILIVVGGLGVCGCAILSAILFPVFASAKYAAKRTTGLSNMKQLAIGAIMYTADADGGFPKAMESALAAKPYLQPYLQNEALFRSVNPNGGEILGDKRLSGRNSYDVLEPDKALMFHDDNPWPKDEAIVSYVDGHARILPFKGIEAAKAKDPFGGAKPKKGGGDR